MANNNNTLTFDNHDTYIYYSDELLKSVQQITLTPTNLEDTDTVRYASVETNLYTNGIKMVLINLMIFLEETLKI